MSTIAQTEAEDTDERGLLGISFFSSRGDGALVDPLKVLPTLASELAQFDRNFKQRIGAALEKKKKTSLPQQLEELIISPPRSLVETERRAVLIIPDALNE